MGAKCPAKLRHSLDAGLAQNTGHHAWLTGAIHAETAIGKIAEKVAKTENRAFNRKTSFYNKIAQFGASGHVAVFAPNQGLILLQDRMESSMCLVASAPGSKAFCGRHRRAHEHCAYGRTSARTKTKRDRRKSYHARLCPIPII